MASVENYDQMLSKLGKHTFFTTLIFLIFLRFLNIIPKIEINNELVPPIKDYKELVEWFLSFGALPFLGAGIAWLLSSFFGMHNIASEVMGLKYIWNKYFIIRPMITRADLEEKLSRKRVKEIMVGLYYPEVKKIDQHYVHIFWRYALRFWTLFEHFLVVLGTTLVISFFNETLPLLLFLYLGIIFFITTTHWLFVVKNKSTDQANQIPVNNIKLFMES